MDPTNSADDSSQEEDAQPEVENVGRCERDNTPDLLSTVESDAEARVEDFSEQLVRKPRKKKLEAPMTFEEMNAVLPPDILNELSLDRDYQIKKRRFTLEQEKLKSKSDTRPDGSTKRKKSRGRKSKRTTSLEKAATPIFKMPKTKRGPSPPSRLNLRAELPKPVPLAPRSEDLFRFLDEVDARPDTVYDLNCSLEQPPENPPKHTGRFLLPDPFVDAVNFFENKKTNLKVAQFVDLFDNTVLGMDIALIRGLTYLAKFNTNKFSTSTIVETAQKLQVNGKDAIIEKRDQLYEEPEHNNGWLYRSIPGTIKLTSAAKQQEEEVKRLEQGLPVTRQKNDKLTFGTNLDMTRPGWKDQWKELKKLPRLFHIKSPKGDMLYYGPSIEGVNELQGYIKVNGVRTPCHQENSRLSSVNINCGPGSCVWIAIATKYWGKVHRMCEDRGIKYVGGSYWPPVADLEEAGIPYYKFTQHVGDVVFVSPGTMHYVQATGPCNNLAWNVAPMKVKQLEEMISQTEWNKVIGFETLVPLEAICFNMAETYWFADDEFFVKVRDIAIKSYAYQKQVLNFLRERLGDDLKILGTVSKSKVAGFFCIKCKIEVCNIILYYNSDSYCVACADKIGLHQFAVHILRPLTELRSVIYQASSSTQMKTYYSGAQNESKWLTNTA